MKNFKVVFNFLPVVLLVVATYFFTSGFSPFGTPQKAIDAKIKPIVGSTTESPSTTCRWVLIFIDASPDNSCGGPWTYCINGGTITPTSNNVVVLDLPCGSTYNVCVKSAKGDCIGTTTIINSCNPCTETLRYIYMYPSQTECNCTQS